MKTKLNENLILILARTCRHMRMQEEGWEEDALHMADPFDLEAQARIAERMRPAGRRGGELPAHKT